ncbi:MAG TPA: formate dehydrogenase subunit delta [Hydrogenophaga sp.]
MDIHNLISMANRIGQFFESFSDRDEALDGISNHIRKFWEPRMRQALLSQWDAGNTEGLLPIVGEAIRTHRAELS